jgi:prolyl-tRNA editing enzyme YbaK/EbsC (Cys-tRNA(Pro) deacylase)
MRAWPAPVERVAAALRAAQVEARLEELPVETPTAVAAARAVGCDTADIVKSVVFVCDDRIALALVQGDRRARASLVAEAAAAHRARAASPVEVRSATGFEAGGVAPFPRGEGIRAFLDERLLARELVWIGAGTPRHLARLAVADLVRVARAETADVAD